MASKLQPESKFQMFQKRSDFDILVNILSEANDVIKKTRSMYRRNINHRQLKVYVQFLLDLELMRPHSEKDHSKRKYFRISSKGIKFLEDYQSLKRLRI